MIKFCCIYCNQKVGVPEESAGETVDCPNCGKDIVVPRLVIENQSPDEIGNHTTQAKDSSDYSMPNILFNSQKDNIDSQNICENLIKIRCNSCNKKIGVPVKFALKKIKCPKCGDVNAIPEFNITNNDINELTPLSMLNDLEIQNDPSSESNIIPEYNQLLVENGTNKGLPKWYRYTGISLGVLVIGFFLWLFIFRDTWEADNSKAIGQLNYEASVLLYKGEIRKGLDTYEELFALVGNRELKYNSIKDTLIEANELYRPVKDRWDNIYYPLMQKRDNAEGLLRSVKLHESIELCRNVLIQFEEVDEEDAFSCELLAEIRDIDERASSELNRLIAQEESVLPKLNDLYQQGIHFNKLEQYNDSLSYLNQVKAIEEKESYWSQKVPDLIIRTKELLKITEEKLALQEKLAHEQLLREKEAEEKWQKEAQARREEQDRRIQQEILENKLNPPYKRVANQIVQSLLDNGSSGFRSAVFRRYAEPYSGQTVNGPSSTSRGKEISVEYIVQSVTVSGLVREDVLSIAVQVDQNLKWQYRQAYLNGKELWIR